MLLIYDPNTNKMLHQFNDQIYIQFVELPVTRASEQQRTMGSEVIIRSQGPRK